MVVSVPHLSNVRGASRLDNDDSIRIVPLAKNTLTNVNGKSHLVDPLDIEDDVIASDGLLGAAHVRKGRFKSIFRRGGLGDFLYESYRGYQVYSMGLVFIVGACETGLVALNRFLFMTGAWRFPYPVAATFAQLLATHVLLVLSASLTRSLAKPLLYLGLGGLIAPPNSSATAASTAVNRDEVRKTDFRATLRCWPLAILFSLKVLLSNLSFAYTVLPRYTLIRIHAVPASLILTSIVTGISHSISTLSSSLAAVIYLFIGSNQPGPSGAWDSNLSGVVSAFIVSLYPIMLLTTFNKMKVLENPQFNGRFLKSGSIQVDEVPTDAENKRTLSAAAHWYLIRRLSFLSILFLTPILLLSGEVFEIYRNCYILDQYKLWTPFVGSFLTSFGVFVATPLLVRATSPLTTTFVMVPRSAYQLALLHADMPSSNWIAIIACYLSSVWYMLVRRSESVTLQRLAN